jgi:hypothetical protein
MDPNISAEDKDYIEERSCTVPWDYEHCEKATPAQTRPLPYYLPGDWRRHVVMSF